MSPSAGSTDARTSSAVSASKPGSSEHRAQHAQHLPARARLAERLHDAVEAPARGPSQLTNVPAVSVNGAIGSSTSAYAVPWRNGLITTTRSAFSSAARAATALAKSNSGSACSSR